MCVTEASCEMINTLARRKTRGRSMSLQQIFFQDTPQSQGSTWWEKEKLFYRERDRKRERRKDRKKERRKKERSTCL